LLAVREVLVETDGSDTIVIQMHRIDSMLERQAVCGSPSRLVHTLLSYPSNGDSIPMMRFTTLWSLDRTVDPATGMSPIANSLAAHWDHDPESVRFFRSSANFIYRVSRDSRPAWLRIAAASERSRPGIEGELDLLAWLDETGIPVVRPIPARSGDLVVSHDTVMGPFHAVLFDHLDGDIRDLDTLSLVEIERWGSTVGRLHTTFASVPETFRTRSAGWQGALEAVESGTLTVPSVVQREADRLRAVLRDLPTTPDVYGLIHTDLELDNLVWNDGEVAILDFDEFGMGWYMLDIAKALTDLLREGENAQSPRVAAFIGGYRQQHALGDDMLALLPEFFALSEFRSYVSLVRAIDIEPEDAEVEWMRSLTHRIRAWMRDYEARL
jgi:Ser/Thr protein kinase RdoA (MazF antagonist)